MPVLNVTSFWLFAIATSAFSALNERELRQRRADLQAMVEVGGRLDDASDPLEQSRIVLAGLVERFEFKRGIVLGRLGRQDDRPRDPRDRGRPDDRGGARLDRQPRLGATRGPAGQAARSGPRPVPRRGAARRAEPARRADDRRRPAGRRDRRRVGQAPAAARRRAARRLDGRPVRLDGGAEPAQRRPAATRPGPGRARLADRRRQPPDVPAEPRADARDAPRRRPRRTRSPRSCSSTSTTSRSSTTRSATPPATRSWSPSPSGSRSLVRSTDLVARLGGDEFAILTEDEPDLARSRAMAERLVHELRAPYMIADRPVVVTSSIGIASARDAVDGAADLVRNADVAMYMAKANGKSGFAIFDPGMHVAIRERNELSVELKRAVELDQLRLVYQPIVDLADGRLRGRRGARPLAAPDARPDRPRPVHRDRRGDRRDPVDRPLGPARDLRAGGPLAARGPRARRRCSSASTSRPARSSSPGFVDGVRDTLARDRARADEPRPRDHRDGAAARRRPATIATLAELRALGVRTVIDDFGTGYFSLSHLRQFPIDILKIAGEFVQDADADPKSPALARAIVAMGRSMNMATVAEGIETARAGGEHARPRLHLRPGLLLQLPAVATTRSWRRSPPSRIGRRRRRPGDRSEEPRRAHPRLQPCHQRQRPEPRRARSLSAGRPAPTKTTRPSGSSTASGSKPTSASSSSQRSRREEALDVLVVADLDRAVGVAGQDRVVDLVGRIGRVGIGRPLEVAQGRPGRPSASGGPSSPPWSVAGAKRLADVVGLRRRPAPPGRRCSNAVASAARRSASVVM